MNRVLSIGESWRQACLRIDRLDARLLLCHVCGCSHADLIARPEQTMSPAQAERFEALLQRREAGEPLAYLVGSAGFYGLEFDVSPAVLIPRPETEVLVDVARERIEEFSGRSEPVSVVDLGTGSGIVAILLARQCPSCEVSAVDVSEDALAVARANAERHAANIRFLHGSWYVPLNDERFDLIVSNPPYIADGDPHLKLNGLPFEPLVALTDGVSGGNGLECLREIITGAARHLCAGGWLLMEHGYDQAVEVRLMLQNHRFIEIASWRDAAGIERVSGGRMA